MSAGDAAPAAPPLLGPRGRLVLVCAGLAAAAAALAGAARLTWYAADVPAPARTPVRVAVSGAEALPGLDGVALLALAGVAAAVALSGATRRLLGAALAGAAGWLGVAVVTTPPPTPAQLAALPGAPAGAGIPAAVAATGAPALAAAGLLVLVVAGVTIAFSEPTLPRFGARHADARSGAADPDPAAAAPDPDRAAWDALDAGRDPTVEPPRGPRG